MNIISMLLLDEIRVAGLNLIDTSEFADLFARFIVNLGVVVLLVRWLYFSATRKKDYLFSYFLISTVVFLLCYLLESVEMQLGFALGLFAIFGIIRYRTDAIPIKEMTYLFIVIGISVINALANVDSGGITIIVFSNLAVIVTTYVLERVWLLRHESSKVIIYDKIDLIKPANYDLLIKDLEERTGIINISKVEIGSIDLLKETCSLTINYKNGSTLQ